MTIIKKITDYIKFVIKQLGHMQLSNYCLFFFSLGVQLMIFLSAPITWISALTFMGTTLGVLCVIAINATKSINGYLGLISGIMFIIVGFSAKNYLSIAEQLSYMVTLDLPVLCSLSWNKNLASKIRHFGFKEWIIAIVFTVAVWAVGGTLIGGLTDDPRPYIDAIAFAISLTGGLVCWLRYSNQYFWWTASGLAQLVLWYVTFKQGGASIGMAVNSFIYLANDVMAFTLSPWYNRRSRAKMIESDRKMERAND